MRNVVSLVLMCGGLVGAVVAGAVVAGAAGAMLVVSVVAVVVGYLVGEP